ncbi:hypothetical protein FBU31_007987 [Coemansia sp. 'formosensis']|nr:hypothetical protein FBU31_007987 [Coemansia sp. 'formosensis']
MVNLRVSFPELEVCNNCEAYEDVIINTREDTVEQVKNAIAIKLGIEVDEFVLGRENDKNEHKSELEMLFSNIYMPINYKPDTDENGDWVPFEHPLYANKFYKGKTGTLSRIISEKKDVYCREYDFDGGQLAHGFASQRAVFNPWNTNP